MFAPNIPWSLLPLEDGTAALLNKKPSVQGNAFESSMLAKYFAATCDPINPNCHTPAYLLASVVSSSILISPERLTTILTSRFEGSPSAYEIKQIGAGSFEFKVASTHVASEIALRGWVRSGCILIALGLKKLSAEAFSEKHQIQLSAPREREPFRGDKLARSLTVRFLDCKRDCF